MTTSAVDHLRTEDQSDEYHRTDISPCQTHVHRNPRNENGSTKEGLKVMTRVINLPDALAYSSAFKRVVRDHVRISSTNVRSGLSC